MNYFILLSKFLFFNARTHFFKCHCKQNKREKNIEGIVEKNGESNTNKDCIFYFI